VLDLLDAPAWQVHQHGPNPPCWLPALAQASTSPPPKVLSEPRSLRLALIRPRSHCPLWTVFPPAPPANDH
jgi:hypothetical protein